MAEGRRERIRKRIRQEGVDGLFPHELLEYMLYPYIPRKDTAGIARALLAEFGSLHGVFTAKESRLASVKGMTATAASLSFMAKFFIGPLAGKSHAASGVSGALPEGRDIVVFSETRSLYAANIKTILDSRHMFGFRHLYRFSVPMLSRKKARERSLTRLDSSHS